MHHLVTRAQRHDYVLVTVLLLALLFLIHPTRTFAPVASSSKVVIDGTSITVDVPRSVVEQEKGLSGRSTLLDGRGMLFIFGRPERYGFWMPDMHFAIDIVWIGTDWHIVDISPNVTPESYPAVFKPRTRAQYVLEVLAGSAERYGWKAGDAVNFDHS